MPEKINLPGFVPIEDFRNIVEFSSEGPIPAIRGYPLNKKLAGRSFRITETPPRLTRFDTGVRPIPPIKNGGSEITLVVNPETNQPEKVIDYEVKMGPVFDRYSLDVLEACILDQTADLQNQIISGINRSLPVLKLGFGLNLEIWPQEPEGINPYFIASFMDSTRVQPHNLSTPYPNLRPVNNQPLFWMNETDSQTHPQLEAEDETYFTDRKSRFGYVIYGIERTFPINGALTSHTYAIIVYLDLKSGSYIETMHKLNSLVREGNLTETEVRKLVGFGVTAILKPGNEEK